MTREELEARLAEARASGVSEAAVAVLRDRWAGIAPMPGSPPAAASMPAPIAAPATEPPAERGSLVPGYQQRVDDRAAQLERYVAENPYKGTARILAGAVASGVDSATAGYSTKALGAVLPGTSMEQAGIDVAASRKAWPGATLVSDIYGLVRSPVGRAVGAVGGLAARATGVARLAEAAATGPFLARAAANTVQNIVSGGAGITALEMVKSRPDTEGPAIAERLRSALHAATSPEAIAISGGLGTAVAGLQGRVSVEAARLRPLMDRWERITGRRPNDAILTDDTLRHQFLDTAARMPELAREAQQIRDQSIAGMRALGADIARRHGAAAPEAQTETAAAGAVRRITGKPAGAREGENIVTEGRRAAERPVFARFGPMAVDRSLGDQFLRSARILQGLRGKTDTAPELDRMVGALREGLEGAPLYGRDLEAVRKQLGKIAYDFNMSDPSAAGWSERGRWEARQLYNVVNHLIERADPMTRSVLERAGQVRVAEQALAGVKTSTINRDAIDKLWTGPDIMTNWRTVRDGGLPEDVDALRGDYIWRMIRAVTNEETGLVNAKKLREITTEKGGRFNRQVAEDVAPGLIAELRDLAALSRIVERGAVKAEGSQTAGRAMRMAKEVTGPVAAAGLLMGLFTNPFHVVTPILTTGVFRQALISARRSMLTGAGQDMLAALALGERPPAFALPQAAAVAGGGLERGIGAGQNALSSVGEMASPAIDWASQALSRPPQGSPEEAR